MGPVSIGCLLVGEDRPKVAHQEEICHAALNAGSSVSIVMSPVNVPVIL